MLLPLFVVSKVAFLNSCQARSSVRPSAVRPTTDPSARPPARFRKDDIPIIIMHAVRATERPTDGPTASFLDCLTLAGGGMGGQTLGRACLLLGLGGGRGRCQNREVISFRDLRCRCPPRSPSA